MSCTTGAAAVASAMASDAEVSVELPAVSAPLNVLYGIYLARRLAEESGWARAARHAGAALGALSLLVLAAVLAQEVVLLRPGLPAPHAQPTAAFVVILAPIVTKHGLAGLLTAGATR